MSLVLATLFLLSDSYVGNYLASVVLGEVNYVRATMYTRHHVASFYCTLFCISLRPTSTIDTLTDFSSHHNCFVE